MGGDRQQAGHRRAVWDARTGSLATAVPTEGDAYAFFSPDNRWLVISTAKAYQFHEVGTWRLGPVIPHREATGAGTVAFSPDGRITAVVQSDRLVELLDAATLRPLAALQTASDEQAGFLAFARMVASWACRPATTPCSCGTCPDSASHSGRGGWTGSRPPESPRDSNRSRRPARLKSTTASWPRESLDRPQMRRDVRGYGRWTRHWPVTRMTPGPACAAARSCSSAGGCARPCRTSTRPSPRGLSRRRPITCAGGRGRLGWHFEAIEDFTAALAAVGDDLKSRAELLEGVRPGL